MKTLDRWIIRRFAFTYLAFATSVVLMFVVTDGFNHLDTFHATAQKTGRPLARVIAAHYSAVLPDIYYLLAPFVTLVAAMWVVFELRRNNELVPLQAAGVAPWRVTMPLFLAGALLAAVMYADKEFVIPPFAQQYRESTNLKKAHVLINPIPDRAEGVLSARYYRPKSGELVEARYTQLDAHFGEAVCAVASRAYYSTKWEGWIFQDGFRIQREGTAEVYEPIDHDGILIDTDVRPQDVESAAVDTLGYLTSKQLEDQYKRIPAFKHIKVELGRRTAYPCASLVLLLLGLPFVLRGDKSAAAVGLLVCIGICLLFFLVTALFEDMGARPGGIHPLLAAWLANIVFLVPGLAAFLRSAR
ncbi:MAG: LptF/LptG family permease [Planctomycetota bacterium]